MSLRAFEFKYFNKNCIEKPFKCLRTCCCLFVVSVNFWPFNNANKRQKDSVILSWMDHTIRIVGWIPWRRICACGCGCDRRRVRRWAPNRKKNFSIFLLFCFSQFTQFRISTNAKSQLKFNQKRLVFKTEYTKCNMNCKSPLKRTTNPTKNMKNFNLFRWININVKSSWNWICLFRVHQIKELFCLHCDFAVDVHCKTFKR